MSREIVCRCGMILSGGLDTYGDIGDEMCWECYASLNGEELEPYYGLGPHHHDLEATGGSFIGSTVLDPLSEKNENGEYDLGYATFVPDPDVPGCGVWTPKPLVGWL